MPNISFIKKKQSVCLCWWYWSWWF